MKFLCHPVYKYLILIVCQYLIFKYSIKIDNNIDKILLVNIFMVFLIDLIIIDEYQKYLLDYNYGEKEEKKKQKRNNVNKIKVSNKPIDDNDFQSYDTKSIVTEHFIDDDVVGHQDFNYTYINNYNDNGIPIDKYNEIDNLF